MGSATMTGSTFVARLAGEESWRANLEYDILKLVRKKVVEYSVPRKLLGVKKVVKKDLKHKDGHISITEDAPGEFLDLNGPDGTPNPTPSRDRWKAFLHSFATQRLRVSPEVMEGEEDPVKMIVENMAMDLAMAENRHLFRLARKAVRLTGRWVHPGKETGRLHVQRVSRLLDARRQVVVMTLPTFRRAILDESSIEVEDRSEPFDQAEGFMLSGRLITIPADEEIGDEVWVFPEGQEIGFLRSLGEPDFYLRGPTPPGHKVFGKLMEQPDITWQAEETVAMNLDVHSVAGCCRLADPAP